MMRRRSSLEQYEIGDDQETFNYAEEENVGSGGSTSGHPLLHDSESKALPVSCIAINKHSTSGGPSSGWLPDRCGHVDDRLNDVLLAEGGGKNSAVLEDIEREEEGGNNTAEEPTDAISVRMSIWRDLCAGHQADERQNWTDNAVLWRRYPYHEDEESCSVLFRPPTKPSWFSTVTTPSTGDTADDIQDHELVTVAGRHHSLTDQGDREHEERRILERFASFPTGSSSLGMGRPAALAGLIVGGSGCGGGSGASTPKSIRKRNKRKGCDSPRQLAEDKEKAKSPTLDDSTKINTTTTTTSTMTAEINESTAKNNTAPSGQGCRAQLCFDSMQLHDKGEGCGEDLMMDECEPPLTSHGMRPARGWALDFLPQDDDDEEVTVSPRVLSPEMDEPAGSMRVRPFGRCKEPQERRTSFIALGNLNRASTSLVNNRFVNAEPDEHPASHRARQLVLLIHSLKERVKLYEDAFEQRYGYRPSHHQKMDDKNTKRLLVELARVRKELKQLKERHHLTEPSDVIEVTEMTQSKDPDGITSSTSFLSNISRNPSSMSLVTPTSLTAGNSSSSSTASVERTVEEVQEHLAENRQLAGRSELVEELSPKEVLDEKTAVQRALLYVESLHGRPATYKHKDLLRPLYDRYRILKRMVVRSGLARSKEEVCDLVPILEYETLELNETRIGGLHRHSAPPTPTLESMEEMEMCAPRTAVGRRHLTTPITGTELRSESCLNSCGSAVDPDPLVTLWKRQTITFNIEENLHALPLNQLVEQMRHVREEKRRLRRTIRDLEADMLRHQGTARYSSHSSGPATLNASISGGDRESDEDAHLLEPVYAQYRHARAKLRLLEALVAKHDGSATL